MKMIIAVKIFIKMAFILHKCNIQEKVFHEYFDLIGK